MNGKDTWRLQQTLLGDSLAVFSGKGLRKGEQDWNGEAQATFSHKGNRHP